MFQVTDHHNRRTLSIKPNNDEHICAVRITNLISKGDSLGFHLTPPEAAAAIAILQKFVQENPE